MLVATFCFLKTDGAYKRSSIFKERSDLTYEINVYTILECIVDTRTIYSDYVGALLGESSREYSFKRRFQLEV